MNLICLNQQLEVYKETFDKYLNKFAMQHLHNLPQKILTFYCFFFQFLFLFKKKKILSVDSVVRLI